MKKALLLGVLAMLMASSPARAQDDDYSPPERSEDSSSESSSSDFEFRSEAEPTPDSPAESSSEPTPDSFDRSPDSADDFESSSHWAHDDGSGTGNDTSTENLYPDNGSDSSGD